MLIPEDARKLLAQASEELEKKNFNEALEKYHEVLKGSSQKGLKLMALEGMEAIASVRSLPEIQKYCQKLDPIMWDYKEPDREIVDSAVKVFIAIANNLGNDDRERAIKMLNHSKSLANNSGTGN